MIYEFQSDDGEVIERMFSMANAPDLGKKIVVKGKTYKRVLSGAIELIREFKPYVCYSKPKGLPGCRTDTKTGRSVIESKSQEREIARARGETDWD